MSWWLATLCVVIGIPVGVVVVVLCIPLCCGVVLFIVGGAVCYVVDGHSAVARIEPWLSTSVARVGHLFSFHLVFSFAFVSFELVVHLPFSLSNWISLSLSFVLLLSSILSFSFACIVAMLAVAFSFVLSFAFSFVAFVLAFAFVECSNVHWRVSSTIARYHT